MLYRSTCSKKMMGLSLRMACKGSKHRYSHYYTSHIITHQHIRCTTVYLPSYTSDALRSLPLVVSNTPYNMLCQSVPSAKHTAHQGTATVQSNLWQPCPHAQNTCWRNPDIDSHHSCTPCPARTPKAVLSTAKPSQHNTTPACSAAGKLSASQHLLPPLASTYRLEQRLGVGNCAAGYQLHTRNGLEV